MIGIQELYIHEVSGFHIENLELCKIHLQIHKQRYF
jgi:hypothetical protein